jgi:hypothetical protein
VARAARRLVLDPLGYHFGIVRLRHPTLDGYTHLVASREGLYAINETSFVKVMTGQYFGLTYADGSHYAFQALGPDRPPPDGRELPPYRRGRIVRLDLRDSRIVGTAVTTTGLPTGIHQIDFIGGRLYLVDTYNSRILKLSADLTAIETAFHPGGYPPQDDWSAGYAHMNSIVGHGGRIHVLRHNGNPEQGMRPSEIIHCDDALNVLETTALNGHAAHNIVFLEDDSTLVCGSFAGELIDGRRVRVRVSNMYTRGLSVDAASVVVGSSFYAVRHGPDNRRYVPGRVHFFDRDYKPVAELTLPAAPTDIRRIDGRDLGLSDYRPDANRAQG